MFSEILKYLRNMKKITQQELADKLNVSKGAVAMWETGKREPESTILIAIAEYFNVSVDYLLGNTTEKSLVTTDEDILAALFGGDKATSKKLWGELIKYAEFLKTQETLNVSNKILPDLGIGKNLRLLRQKAGLTQEESVAKLRNMGLSVSREMLSQMENDKYSIKVSVIVGLKQIYKTTYDEIFKGLFIDMQ